MCLNIEIRLGGHKNGIYEPFFRFVSIQFIVFDVMSRANICCQDIFITNK